MSPHPSVPAARLARFCTAARRIAPAGFVALALLCVSQAVRSDGPTTNEIRVDVLGLRNDKGIVDCLLFSSADGFPSDENKAQQKMHSIIEHGRAACVFDDPRAGTYAVSFMHDENENGKLDTNFVGIPTEGIGASNDARALLGPPKWEDAKFEHAVGLQALELHVKYF